MHGHGHDFPGAMVVQTKGPYHSTSATGLYTWREVLWHVNSAGRVLSRSLPMELEYKRHRARLRATGQSSTHDVLRYFSPGQIVAFTPARFPYALSPEISHWIMWVQPDAHNAWQRDVGPLAEMRRHVQRLYGPLAGESTYVQNLEGERSVTTLPHYHCFVRNSSRTAAAQAPLRWDLQPFSAAAVSQSIRTCEVAATNLSVESCMRGLHNITY